MTRDRRLPLALTMGDPAGVGAIATWACWRNRLAGSRPFYVAADPGVLARAAGAGLIAEIAHESEAADVFQDALPVLALSERVTNGASPGKPHADSVAATLASIRQAVISCLAGRSAGVVTNPISKSLVMATGFPHPGHTEFLAELAAKDGETPLPVMMLAGGGLRVALVTIHAPLARVPGLLSADRIVATARIVHRDLQSRFGLKHPRIGVCGLNPHAGEEGVLGREEIEIIHPAARRLREEGIDASDARPGDTIFHEMREGRFDAVLAMYHDQGLIPVKTLDLWGGVNVTLGLPFIRTSPDHGTAYEAAASGSVRCESLQAAIHLADQMAVNSGRDA